MFLICVGVRDRKLKQELKNRLDTHGKQERVLSITSEFLRSSFWSHAMVTWCISNCVGSVCNWSCAPFHRDTWAHFTRARHLDLLLIGLSWFRSSFHLSDRLWSRFLHLLTDSGSRFVFLSAAILSCSSWRPVAEIFFWLHENWVWAKNLVFFVVFSPSPQKRLGSAHWVSSEQWIGVWHFCALILVRMNHESYHHCSFIFRSNPMDVGHELKSLRSGGSFLFLATKMLNKIVCLHECTILKEKESLESEWTASCNSLCWRNDAKERKNSQTCTFIVEGNIKNWTLKRKKGIMY